MHQILNLTFKKQFGNFFYQILNLLISLEDFLTSLWRHFNHNIICFPVTFLLLASMALFCFFCFIQNKRQEKFCYVNPLTYLRENVVQS